jgi:hypothetical protein
VNPENGLKLNDGFERRRAQKWALSYEREHGRIYCRNRLENFANREKSPVRPMWMAFKNAQREFEAEEKIRREYSPPLNDGQEIFENTVSREWRRLKEYQQRERAAFFVEGKKVFSDARNSIFREVREEFRPRWGNYFRVLRRRWRQLHRPAPRGPSRRPRVSRRSGARARGQQQPAEPPRCGCRLPSPFPKFRLARPKGQCSSVPHPRCSTRAFRAIES